MTGQQRQLFDPAGVSMSGVMIAAVVLGALAVRTVTAEYSTGMIRATFTAMPGRPLVLAAKAATAAAFSFPVALLCNVAGFELGQRIFAGQHAQVGIGHPGVDQAMVFGALAVSLTAVIGVGLGGVILHTAGAATTLALIIVGGLTAGQLLPAGWRQYFPRHRHPGGRDGPPLGRTPQPRPGPRRARRIRRHRPGRSDPAGISQQRLTFVPTTRRTFSDHLDTEGL
jgi:hypothetical protein